MYVEGVKQSSKYAVRAVKGVKRDSKYTIKDHDIFAYNFFNLQSQKKV